MRQRSFLAALCAATALQLVPAIALAQNAAERAVEAAKQFAGTTLTMTEEAGLMAMLGINTTGPEWEQLTGVAVRTTEVPNEELFPKALLEHQAGTGAYDILTIAPAWIPDLARAGVIRPIDDYVTQYGADQEFADIAPAFAAAQTYDGQIYGLLVDGDVHLLFYRKDLFEDAANAAEFQEKYGYPLAVPTTWDQFGDVCQFFTDKYAPALYGAGLINTGYMYYFFFERFRNAGGRFFDPETMKATVNSDIGVQTLAQMVEQNKCQPPGVETWGFGESLSALNAGQIAMTISWPPLARWSQGLDAGEQALSWVPASQVVDKVGYALPPGGHPEMASGVVLAVSSDSDTPEAAYLYIQWLASAQESLKNVMRPTGLRDPFRISHYEDPTFRALWPGAPAYLDTLRLAGEQGLQDLTILNTFAYWDSLGRGVVAAIGGQDPKEALDRVAEEWDSLTEQVGVDAQREAYATWAAKSSAYPQQ